jgi:hypothetical protein
MKYMDYSWPASELLDVAIIAFALHSLCNMVSVVQKPWERLIISCIAYFVFWIVALFLFNRSVWALLHWILFALRLAISTTTKQPKLVISCVRRHPFS